ncbi:MAG: RlmE family RNA methyltransferase [Arenicellales bacterium]|nr:RlmE family RNA methyltransferase [Arenicellales bacterium]
MSQKKRRTNQWLQNHRKDGFVKRASQAGYRSRAVFKLEEIDHRDHLIASGMKVIDLGAAPGGWSQYLAEKVGPGGKVVAIDLLDIQPINNVTLLQGDFTDPRIHAQVIDELGGPADLVLSDAAPNISGISEVDQANFIAILDAALDFSTHILRKGGNLLIKVFEFPDLQQFRRRCEREFKRVYTRKPSASRSKSREYYLIATGLLHTKHRIG